MPRVVVSSTCSATKKVHTSVTSLDCQMPSLSNSSTPLPPLRSAMSFTHAARVWDITLKVVAHVLKYEYSVSLEDTYHEA